MKLQPLFSWILAKINLNISLASPPKKKNHVQAPVDVTGVWSLATRQLEWFYRAVASWQWWEVTTIAGMKVTKKWEKMMGKHNDQNGMSWVHPPHPGFQSPPGLSSLFATSILRSKVGFWMRVSPTENFPPVFWSLFILGRSPRMQWSWEPKGPPNATPPRNKALLRDY